MGADEQAITERAYEAAVAIEFDDGVVAAVQHIHVLVGTNGDTRCLLEVPADGELGPLRVKFVGQGRVVGLRKPGLRKQNGGPDSQQG